MIRRLPSRGTEERRLSDPLTSRAVFIEAHAFTRNGEGTRDRDRHLDDRPTVAAGCRRLAELFRDPAVWGLPEENCTVISQPTRDSMLEAVHKAAADATDTLVVYYAGHGLFYNRSTDLHLAVPETTKDKSFTAVKYEELRGILLSATRVRRKVVILDCCFSGAALRQYLSADTDAVRTADVEGTFVLAASHATKMALAPPGEDYPAFTGELIALLTAGDPGGPELLTMADVFDHLDRSLMQKNRPRPQQLNRDRGAQICLVRNRAPLPPPELGDAQAEADISRPRRRNVAAALVTLAALLALSLTLWLLPNDHGPDDYGSDKSASGTPSVLAGITCKKAKSAYDVSIKVVHDAACAGDFDTMEVAMDRNGFDGTGFSAAKPSEVIAAWKKRPDSTKFLQALVTLLESSPTPSQGGPTFDNGKGVAYWERGAGTQPDTQLRWSGYYDCQQPPDSSAFPCSE